MRGTTKTFVLTAALLFLTASAPLAAPTAGASGAAHPFEVGKIYTCVGPTFDGSFTVSKLLDGTWIAAVNFESRSAPLIRPEDRKIEWMVNTALLGQCRMR